jgi:hypothetical protein
LTFKTQLFALSNVLPEKQKIMIKGKLLKVITKNFSFLKQNRMMSRSDLPV